MFNKHEFLKKIWEDNKSIEIYIFNFSLSMQISEDIN